MVRTVSGSAASYDQTRWSEGARPVRIEALDGRVQRACAKQFGKAVPRSPRASRRANGVVSREWSESEVRSCLTLSSVTQTMSRCPITRPVEFPKYN
jgi:hypothetical protein